MDASRYLRFATRGIARKGPPLHLTVFVTGRCNARCRHCFHWREVEAGVPGPTLAEFERLAASAQRMGPLLWVSFGGGEPFLRNDLPEIAACFARRGLRHLAIPTNGLVEERLAPMVERVLAEHPDLFLSIGVSFDGPEQIHDSIRQVPGGHRRAKTAVRTLRAIERRLPRGADGRSRLGVGILVTLTSENQDVLARHVEELVEELAPDNVTLNLARGTAKEAHLLEVDLARYRELVETKRRLVASGKLPYFDFPLAKLAVARDELMYEHVGRIAAGDRSRHLPCTAGTLSAVVFENGEVHPCEILGKSIGNLNDVEWDLERLWRAHAAESLREEIAEKRCACTWECAQADNVLFQPRLWPKLALRTLSSRANAE
ncbi:MAG TPA: radical SAM protein, partial [Planctomycetota bacterium]|nr:radical SAM protein [Planctomycetota bacterium]